jgi:hypothetical protein
VAAVTLTSGELQATFVPEMNLLAAFPFPHRLETAIEVDGRTLSVATAIRPSGRRSVPGPSTTCSS